MSSETRTLLIVLLVCGFLMCGCVVLPMGIGVGFFYLAAERTQAAMAQEAMAREQAVAARAQAQAQAALKAIPESLPTPPTDLPVSAPSAAPGIPAPTSPPSINLPPIGGFGLPQTPPDVLKAMLEDVEKRKELYRAFKQLRETEEQIKSLSGNDPAAAALITGIKQQALDTFKASGLTQEDIDKILAEGDKEGW